MKRQNRTSLIHFIEGVNSRLESGVGLPRCIEESPLVIGQVASAVTGLPSLYLIPVKETSSDVHFLKAGIARKVSSRVNGIRTAIPLKIGKAMYFCQPRWGVTVSRESAVHRILDPWRYNGEWFKFDDKASMEAAVKIILHYLEDDMGPYFNSFVFDAGYSDKQAVCVAKNWLEIIWYLSDESAEMDHSENLLKAVCQLTATSEGRSVFAPKDRRFDFVGVRG